MTIKYLMPILAAAGLISPYALAGDVTRQKNELSNEMVLGYQFGFNDTYHLAFEVFGQKPMQDARNAALFKVATESSPVDDREFLNNEEDQADFDWTTGVRLRPGYNVTKNTRLFLDGGVVWGDFNMELTEFDAATAALDPAENSNMLRGWRYGAGIEHHLPYMNAFSVVLDYSMTEFEAAEMSSSSNYPDYDTDLNNPINGPAYQQVMLSLKAEFDSGLGF